MKKQVTMTIHMKLLSDAIFGSGYSIPGGEDIAVCQDAQGFPYFKGSTFKGLLRDALEDWLCWTGDSKSQLNALLGERGWDGLEDDRRIHLTELRPYNPPKAAESCFSFRTFTSLENGVVKTGSLRTASCICAGLCFSGMLTCREDDAELLRNALACIKWVGTMRSRGFGQVRVTGRISGEKPLSVPDIKKAGCIRYRLRTVSPVLITDLSRSRGNGMETRGFIPGTAIRGMVMSLLSAQQPEWFSAHRRELLGDGTRFLDAVPVYRDLPVLPAIMGFYEDKEETRFESVIQDGTFSPGLKRADVGSFCAPENETLFCWSAESSGSTRIAISADGEYQTEVFQTRHLDAGHEFEGYIQLCHPEFAQQIIEALHEDIWIGADRHSGFGRCELILTEAINEPAWLEAYGCRCGNNYDKDLYLLAVSPFTMLDASGSPCGLNLSYLAQALGVGEVAVKVCSTSIREYGGYNRTWQSRVPAAQMYERGSLFHLVCDRSPNPERLAALQRSGVGIRRAEGFGQILFLEPALLENLKRKKHIKPGLNAAVSSDAENRRHRCRWVMDNAWKIRQAKLSASQIGSLQAICEECVAKGGDLNSLNIWLNKNLSERGARHGNRFQIISTFVNSVLSGEMDDDGVSHSHSMIERLETLTMLLDFSRKGSRKEDDA